VTPIHTVPSTTPTTTDPSYVTLETTYDVDGKYKHAVLFTSDSRVRQLTLGQFNVDKVVAVNNQTMCVTFHIVLLVEASFKNLSLSLVFSFFTSGLIDVTSRRLLDAAQSHLYSVPINTGDDAKLTCLTCNDNCLFNDIVSNQQSEFYVRTCSNGGSDLSKVPTVDVNSFQINCSDNKVLRAIGSSANFGDNL